MYRQWQSTMPQFFLFCSISYRSLSTILADYQRWYQAVEEQIEDLRLHDQIEEVRSTGKSKILEILDEEQRQKFEKMTAPLDPPSAIPSE